LIYRQDIEIFHDCHSDFNSFLKQAYNYGRGNYLVQYLHQDQPLLKELKTQSPVSFILATIVNFLKIPRFCYFVGRSLSHSKKDLTFYEKFRVYVYFALHKAAYIAGNIAEFKRAAQITGGAGAPEFIIFDITHQCNLRCAICEIRNDDSKKELKTYEVKGLILQAKEWGVKEFVLSGGEALLRPDIFEIINFVSGKNYHLGILTNGILLDDSFIRKLSPYLINGALSLSISLDALTPRIHDEIRGTEGSFDRTLAGLKILSELKKSHDKVNFNTISIILNANLEELASLADFLKSLDLNSIQFQPLLANNLVMKERSNRARYWIPKERFPVLDKTIDQLIDFKQKNPHLLRNSENNLRLIKQYFRGALASDQISCSYASKTMLITTNGDVTTCFDCYGNIRKASLRSIHTSGEANRARQRVRACQNPCLLPCFCD
jgi:MoaA/NifB/PqqE/SkfB family radical SAM enzyme